MCAPRRFACSYSSTMSDAAPSPITKPSRVTSKGRQARAAGSPSHWLIVLMMANALNVRGLSGASAAPATMISAKPSRM